MSWPPCPKIETSFTANHKFRHSSHPLTNWDLPHNQSQIGTFPTANHKLGNSSQPITNWNIPHSQSQPMSLHYRVASQKYLKAIQHVLSPPTVFPVTVIILDPKQCQCAKVPVFHYQSASGPKYQCVKVPVFQYQSASACAKVTVFQITSVSVCQFSRVKVFKLKVSRFSKCPNTPTPNKIVSQVQCSLALVYFCPSVVLPQWH